MPRPLFDTPYIFGIHEPGGEQHMIEAGKPGWIVFTEALAQTRGYQRQGLLSVEQSGPRRPLPDEQRL